MGHSTHTDTHTHTHPLFSLCRPLYKIDVAFPRKLDKEAAAAALKGRVLFKLISNQADFLLISRSPAPFTLQLGRALDQLLTLNNILISSQPLLLSRCPVVLASTLAAHVSSKDHILLISGGWQHFRAPEQRELLKQHTSLTPLPPLPPGEGRQAGCVGTTSLLLTSAFLARPQLLLRKVLSGAHSFASRLPARRGRQPRGL